MKKTLTRRDLIKKGMGLGIGTSVLASLLGPIIATVVKNDDDSISDGEVDPNPIIKLQKEDQLDFEGDIRDIIIKNVPFKLAGVSHSRDFAKRNFSNLEQLVKNCSTTVLEMGPYQMDKKIASNEGRAYFGTMIELCKKYQKPIVFLDPYSSKARFMEIPLGAIGAYLIRHNAFSMVAANSTKRDFLIKGAKTIGGSYLLMSVYPFGYLNRQIIIGEEKADQSEAYFLSHITDQRNVQITNRLIKLTEALPNMNLQGDYVLVNFGKNHTIGVDYYLKHPTLRKIKSDIYRVTYDLCDSDVFDVFTPQGDSWERHSIEKFFK